MPYHSNTVFFDMPYTRHEKLCAAWSTSTGNTMTYEELKQWNDRESRPFPPDPIQAMTSQSTQYTQTQRIGYVEYVSQRTRDWSCPYRAYYDVRKWGYAMVPAQVDLAAPPDYNVDWNTDLRLKIKEEAINLGTMVAEYRQSAKMFGSAAKSVVNAWKVLRGKRPRKALTPCSISAAHLVYTYGVAPLLSDLYDSVEALKLRLEHPVRRKYYVSAKAYDYGTSTGTWGAGTWECWYRRKDTQRVNAYVDFDVEKAALFTLGNPLEIAWERVPYSFVVDWMIPIGDYLASLDALHAVETMKVSLTEKRQYDHSSALSVTDVNGLTVTSHESGINNWLKRREHERIIYNTLPLPSLPKYRPSTSLKALSNALALLWQTFAGGRNICKIKNPQYLPSALGLR